jgi:S-adenosylmethionine synthetase
VNYLFTSESVSEGHPDKVCDQISDAILDTFIEKDIKLGIADDSQINTRLGCETLCTTNKIVVAGEGRGQLFKTINGVSVVDRELITEIARGVVKDIGYDQNGFSYHGADVEVLLHGQSPDIAMGVNAKKKKSGEGRRCRRPGHDVRLRLYRERSVREGLVCRRRSTSHTKF